MLNKWGLHYELNPFTHTYTQQQKHWEITKVTDKSQTSEDLYFTTCTFKSTIMYTICQK